jgi:5S rRNA maturation endonuclease (ribonuclease M5)
MSLIDQELLAFLPPKRKQTPSGWISFNAVCCHHNGEKPDTRKRGGVLAGVDTFQYHCFNCGFKAGWSKGKLLSKNTKMLFSWLGMNDSRIGELSLEALREQESLPTTKKPITFDLNEVALPDNCKKFTEIEPSEEFLNVAEYIINRGMDFSWYDWMWADTPGYKDRVIIPFYNEGKIVGYTGRKITEGKPKYLTDAQAGYVFNIDKQHDDREYVIVVEGQFDAIAIDGVAIMHNEPNETQCTRLRQLGKEVIIVPDRDKPGAKLLKSALDNNWSMSLPDWEPNIKDVADAVAKYGRVYTLQSILKNKESNKVKIELAKKKLEKMNE